MVTTVLTVEPPLLSVTLMRAVPGIKPVTLNLLPFKATVATVLSLLSTVNGATPPPIVALASKAVTKDIAFVSNSTPYGAGIVNTIGVIRPFGVVTSTAT